MPACLWFSFQFSGLLIMFARQGDAGTLATCALQDERFPFLQDHNEGFADHKSEWGLDPFRGTASMDTDTETAADKTRVQRGRGRGW